MTLEIVEILWKQEKVVSLDPDEVFVFGGNMTGWHGAGAAGMAFRGESANTWRGDPVFLAATKAPYGSPERIGQWAVFGEPRGPQQGKTGRSYAIVTVTKPGSRKSVSLIAIRDQLYQLLNYVLQHPELRFVVTPLGEGYSGYTSEQMGLVWKKVFQGLGYIPSNMRFVRC